MNNDYDWSSEEGNDGFWEMKFSRNESRKLDWFFDNATEIREILTIFSEISKKNNNIHSMIDIDKIKDKDNNNERKSIKDDDNKSRVDLIPSEAILEIGKVFNYGAQKYSPENWRYDFDWSRLYSAALRHLYEFWQGKDLDPETNISHIAHAGSNIMMLLSLIINNKGNDDRFIN